MPVQIDSASFEAQESTTGTDDSKQKMNERIKRNMKTMMTMKGLQTGGSDSVRLGTLSVQKTKRMKTAKSSVSEKSEYSSKDFSDGGAAESKDPEQEEDHQEPFDAQETVSKQMEDVFKTQGLTVSERSSEREVVWVDGQKFNIFIGAVVALNCILIGIDTDVNSGLDGSKPSMTWQIMDSIFAVIWVVEVVVKVYYHRMDYFRKGWNRLDFFLAGLAVVEAWLLRAFNLDSGAQAGDFTAYRMVRIARMLRLLRLIKVMRMIEEVWLIIQGFVQALRTLVWVFVLLGICIYCSAVYMTTIVGQTCDLDYRDQGIEFDDCEYLFGKVHSSMLSLFQVITFDAWSEVIARSVLRGKPYLYAFFLVFLFCTSFGLLNIVVGVIVENTLNISDNNKKLQAQRQEHRLRKELEALREVFDEADTDDSGGVDRDEFHEVMKREDVQQLFAEMELPFNEPDTLYEIFDTDKVGVLSIHAFVDGAIKFKGPPTGYELRSMTIDVKGVASKVERIERMLKDIDLMPDSEKDADSSVADDVSMLGVLKRRPSAQWSGGPSSPKSPTGGKGMWPEQGDIPGGEQSAAERCDVIDQAVREVRTEQATLFSEVQHLLSLARPIAMSMGIQLKTQTEPMTQTSIPTSSADVGVNDVNGFHDENGVNGVHEENGFSSAQGAGKDSNLVESATPHQKSAMELMRSIEEGNQLVKRRLDEQARILEKANPASPRKSAL